MIAVFLTFLNTLLKIPHPVYTSIQQPASMTSSTVLLLMHITWSFKLRIY